MTVTITFGRVSRSSFDFRAETRDTRSVGAGVTGTEKRYSARIPTGHYAELTLK